VPVYDPIVLARQVATLDQLCNGRFLFGITPAWDELMIRNHGIEPSCRWQLMREKVLAMKALWTENEAEFHGRFVDFEPVLVGVIVTAGGAFDHCDVDDVVIIGSAGQLPDPTDLTRGHLVNIAADQHASQAGLARPTSHISATTGAATIGTTSSAMKPT
jgi:hypothetical protein